ncbi:kxDL motif-containing protein CG10681-like [Panonychus citri]|uniref:kxDL motif-containing protein CG10681-like n=1 Tax=Panonychus citri TaxID=50023 RepID=UPI002306EBD8|nr:kxDL motif-containing protein CG10681-like [Panonychus citri]
MDLPSDDKNSQEQSSEQLTDGKKDFIGKLLNLIDQRDLNEINRVQRHQLARFEKTNEMLVNCNALSAARYEMAMKEIRRFGRVLKQMREDLDYIHQRTKFINQKYYQQHPDAFKSLKNKGNVLEEAEDEES